VYTTQGIPIRLYRQKYMPVVTCASWKNYIMVVGNGGARGDGMTELTYSIEDVLNDEMIQDGDTVALPPNTHLKSVFFSEDGVRTPRLDAGADE
jgi:chromosome transmission fidelity protein 4